MLLVAAGLALPSSVFADPITTPMGIVDRSCVHEVPPGATVDLDAGRVNVGDKVIEHHGRCGVPWQPDSHALPSSIPGQVVRSDVGSPGASGGGWYAFSAGNATRVQGLTQFNYLDVQWTVPSAPNDSNSDTSVLYLFPSIENLGQQSNWSTWVSIIQPILQWGYNSYNGGHYWQLESMAVVAGGGVYFSSPIAANPGDTLEGVIYQFQTNPDGWIIYAANVTQGTSTTFNASPMPATWPKYNFAQVGVLEGYGNAAESVGLNSCLELPWTYLEGFTTKYLYEAGPYWNSYNDACPLVSWSYYANPAGLSPSCAWNAMNNGACGSTLLVWFP
jgi:hypothetical protein